MGSRSASLTHRGWGLLVAAGVMGLGGVLFGIQELYPIAAATVVLVLGSRWWAGIQAWDLRVARRIHPGRVQAGTEARVELSVRNYSSRRSPLVVASDPFDGGKRWARFAIAPLGPGETRVASYRLPTARRGVFRLGPLEIQLTDPFGLARVVTSNTPDASLTVHPRIERLTFESVSAHSDRDARLPLPVLGRGGGEFYGLREYQPGDDVRYVHWPSTARLDDLVVRQPENLWRGRVTIALDLRAGAHDVDTLEASLSAAASLGSAAMQAGLHVRLVTTAGTDTGFGTSGAHMAAVLDALAGASTHRGAMLTDGLKTIRTGDPLTIITTDVTSDLDLAAAFRLGGVNGTSGVVFERQRTSSTADRTPTVPPPGRRYVRVPAGTSFRAAWERARC